MRSNYGRLFLTLWMPIAGAQAASDLSAISVGELGRVQSETILLKAKAERTKAEREASGSLTVPQPATAQFQAGLPTPAQGAASGPREPSLPVVKQISGSGQKLRATLLYSGGSEIDVQPGSELQEGFRVLQVTLDGVVLVREGKRFPLVFGSQVSSSQRQMGLPGLLPGQP